MSTEYVIELHDLSKIYGKGDIAVNALQGINLQVERGEFVAIMGPSGSGKSTLMNILGCLDRPSSGMYLLDGEDVSRLSRTRLADVRNRSIGFIFQSYNLLARTTAAQNVMLPLLYRRTDRLSGRQSREKALESLKRVGLENRSHHLPNQLSGGQQQRVAIARALVNGPAILLADEPTGNLDTTSGREILELLCEVNAQGATIVMVTHDPESAENARRIVHLRDGQVESDGPNGVGRHE